MNYLILKMALRSAIYILVVFLSLSFYYFFIYIRPARWRSESTPQSFDLKYEDIVLKTKDGVRLSGWFIPQKNSNKAVIICHGYPTDKGNVLEIAAFLAPYYNLLLFDFRAMGESGGKFTSGGWKEREDFLSAIRFLKERGFNDIGALGFSMGAAVILMSENPQINPVRNTTFSDTENKISNGVKAIVSDSSYADLEGILRVIFKKFGIFRSPFVKMMKLYYRLFFKANMDWVSPSRYMSRIKTPVFLIHGGRDSQIPLRHLELLHQQNPRSELWIISAADHGEGLSLRPEEYKEKILKFFRDNL